jgi:hypothetical protein
MVSPCSDGWALQYSGSAIKKQDASPPAKESDKLTPACKKVLGAAART